MEQSDSAYTLTCIFLRALPTFTQLLFIHHRCSGGSLKGSPLLHSDFLPKLGVWTAVLYFFLNYILLVYLKIQSLGICLAVSSVQFSSVAQSCPTLCDPMDCSTPGFPVHPHLLELAETQVHRVSDAIQPSHPLSAPSPAPNPSQHQSLFQWVNSSHEVAKGLEFQL